MYFLIHKLLLSHTAYVSVALMRLRRINVHSTILDTKTLFRGNSINKNIHKLSKKTEAFIESFRYIEITVSVSIGIASRYYALREVVSGHQ